MLFRRIKGVVDEWAVYLGGLDPDIIKISLLLEMHVTASVAGGGLMEEGKMGRKADDIDYILCRD